MLRCLWLHLALAACLLVHQLLALRELGRPSSLFPSWRFMLARRSGTSLLAVADPPAAAVGFPVGPSI